METKQRSVVWRYFAYSEPDGSKVRCNMCSAIISRGGVGKSAGTSCMKNHLKWRHQEEFITVFGDNSFASEFVVYFCEKDQMFFDDFVGVFANLGAGRQDGAVDEPVAAAVQLKGKILFKKI